MALAPARPGADGRAALTIRRMDQPVLIVNHPRAHDFVPSGTGGYTSVIDI